MYAARRVVGPAGCFQNRYAPNRRRAISILTEVMRADAAGPPPGRASPLILFLLRSSTKSIKPSTAINHPPAKHQQRQCERQVPPERWQQDAHYNAQHGEQKPEDFLFHRGKP